MAVRGISAGNGHIAMIRGDYHLWLEVAGRNDYGQCDVPDWFRPGEDPMQVSCGGTHTVVLLRDGSVICVGDNQHGQCSVPESIPASSSGQVQRFKCVSAGARHTVLLRMDGTAVAFGLNGDGQCNIPALHPILDGRWYVQCSAGRFHTVLLCNDGTAVACGRQSLCGIPPLPDGYWFASVAAGQFHSVFLRCDGCALACGSNVWGQCNIPALPAGRWYTVIAAGATHTVLLRNDGAVVTNTCCGSERFEIDFPGGAPELEVPNHRRFNAIAAGWRLTVVHGADEAHGQVLVLGDNLG